MTRPRRPNRRRTDREPVFTGDLPADAESITEAISRVPDYDGATFPLAAPADLAGQDTEPFTRTRRSRFYRIPVAPLPLPPPAPAATPSIPALGSQPDPRHDIIARELLEGWPHLTEIRCTYPAASHPTPIPCGRVHTDDTAGDLRGLRLSAFNAGWHLDAFGQWACPRCCQDNPAYRTLYPVTHWHPDAAAARLARDTAAEFWLQREAEIGVALRTSAAFADGHRHRRTATR